MEKSSSAVTFHAKAKFDPMGKEKRSTKSLYLLQRSALAHTLTTSRAKSLREFQSPLPGAVNINRNI